VLSVENSNAQDPEGVDRDVDDIGGLKDDVEEATRMVFVASGGATVVSEPSREDSRSSSTTSLLSSSATWL
jgi:hypothetical protein